MAIRIHHQMAGGTVGSAAFAAGFGQGRQRRGKYMFDLLRDQQRHNWRMQERAAVLGGRAMAARAGGLRAGAMAEPGGMWIDPAEAQLLTDEDRMGLRRQQRAQQQAMARAAKMGRKYAGPRDALPFFVPQAEIEAGREFEAAERERMQELEDEERQWALRQRTADLAADAKTRKAVAQAKADNLLPIPEIATPIQRRQLQDLAADIQVAAAGGDVDFNDDGQADDLDDLVETYQGRVREIGNVNPAEMRQRQAEEMNREVFYLDPATGQVSADPQKAREGWRPVDRDRQLIDLGEDRAEIQAQEMQAAQEAVWDLKMKTAQKEAEMAAVDAGLEAATPAKVTAAGKQKAAMQKELDILNEQLGAAEIQQHRVRHNDPEFGTRPLPPGVPAGARWVDEQTIELPDGSQWRQ